VILKHIESFGNSVVVNVIEALAEEIYKELEDMKAKKIEISQDKFDINLKFYAEAKLKNLDPLSLEYDKITIFSPYSTRVNGIYSSKDLTLEILKNL